MDAIAFAAKMNKDFKKKYDKSVIFAATDDKFKIEKIPTGIVSFDYLTGGGIPVGRWTEIYGDESLLKTSISMMAMASAQRMGFPVMYCNVERNVSKELFELRGVDTNPEKLFILQQDVAEDYIDVIKVAMQNNVFKVIVIDSIAALFPRREADSKSDTTVGSQGLLTSRMGRVLTASNDNSTALILVNQTREKIGVMFGDSTTRPGGRAPRFYDSMVVRLTRITSNREIQEGQTKKGRGYRQLKNIEIAIELEKTKAGGQMGNETVMHYDMVNNRIDDTSEIIGLGAQQGVLQYNRGNITIGNQKLSRTEFEKKLSNDKFKTLLKEKIVGKV